MKKNVLLLTALLCFGITKAQIKPGRPLHHVPAHPEMYSKDTTHIDKDSTQYTIDNLGPAINLEHKSGAARVSPDGKTLYFVKDGHPENLKETRDIWVSQFNDKDSSWHPAEHMPEPINNYGDNLVHWVSKDGSKLLLHNVYLKNKMSTRGISMSEKQADGSWSFPKKVKIKGYKNTDICSFELSPDEEVLISAIKHKDTRGQQDLYVSFRIGPYKYSKPENMGPVVNTKGIEATAFLAPDGNSIYFSSNGQKPTFGGFDIYESKRLDDTWLNWGKPRHVGAPFNTRDDDLYFSLPDSNDYVYLSRHFGGNKDTNVYSDIIRIKLKELDPVVLLSGIVNSKYYGKKLKASVKFLQMARTDSTFSDSTLAKADTSKPYSATLVGKKKYIAVIEAFDHETIYDTIDLADAKPGKRTMTKSYAMQLKPAFLGRVYSGKDSTTPIASKIKIYEKKTGKIVFDDQVVPADSIYKAYVKNGMYTYSVRSEGYLKDTNEVDMMMIEKLRRKEKNFYLKKIEKGLTFTIRNILFKYNSHVLENYSFWELDRIADILKDSPFLEVEIGGHTDNVGNDGYNLALSQRRANSVVTYLVAKGITNKIHAKGYGEAKPIDTNLTPQGRGVNRRVEFVVLNVGEDPTLLYKPTELKPGQAPPPDIDPLNITK